MKKENEICQMMAKIQSGPVQTRKGVDQSLGICRLGKRARVIGSSVLFEIT